MGSFGKVRGNYLAEGDFKAEKEMLRASRTLFSATSWRPQEKPPQTMGLIRVPKGGSTSKDPATSDTTA